MIRRYAAAILVTGALASGGVIAARASSGTTTASTPIAAGQTATGAQIAGMNGHGPGRGDFGGPGSFGGFGRPGGLTVTGISGNTITAGGPNGKTVTIAVSASTTYSEAGATATLSDIHVGSKIAVRSASTGAGTATLTATSVTILLPATAGVVSSVNGNTITVTGRDNAAHTITVAGTTRYRKAGQAASLAEFTTGTSIVAEGTLSGSTLSAQLVTIQVPHLDGAVTAVNGASYTIKDRDGTTYTVNVAAGTTYANADGTAATAASVKVGVNIGAEGTLSSDGKTLSALRVTIMPAGAGHDGRGGPGGSGGTPPFGMGSSGTAM